MHAGVRDVPYTTSGGSAVARPPAMPKQRGKSLSTALWTLRWSTAAHTQSLHVEAYSGTGVLDTAAGRSDECH
jgi:hypothetical protein